MTPHPTSDLTRHRLLGATAQLLRRRGYHGAGTAEILATSGVPKGSLYHHFPAGKAELAAQSLRLSGAAVAERLDTLAERSGSVAGAVRRFCDDHAVELESGGYVDGCPLATVALESATLEPGVRQEVAAAFAGMLDVVARRLRADGLHHARARALAVEIVAGVEGALLLAKATQDVAPLRIVRDRLVARIGEESP